MTSRRLNNLSSSGGADLPAVDNPAGLDALAYRVRTHSGFTTAMAEAFAGSARLRGLATADTNDPSVALVDAWAVTLDVLSFYQERIANEGYLRTATEFRSVQELGRAVGYAPNPGIAAETWLAFTLHDTPGAPEKVTIDVGTKVQSVPGPGELPQIFETVEKIEARPEWNTLKPRLAKLRWPQKGDTELYLKGANTNLKPGDAILLVGDERRNKPDNDNWDFRRLLTVAPDAQRDRTRVSWKKELGNYRPPSNPTCKNLVIHAFRQRAALFGHNAPDWTAMPSQIKQHYCDKHNNKKQGPNATIADDEWPDFSISGVSGPDNTASPYSVHLDALYPRILPSCGNHASWVVLVCSDYTELYEVSSVWEDARTNFTLSIKTTRLELTGENLKEQFDAHVRDTMVFAQSEPLEIAETPIDSQIDADQIEIALDQSVTGMEKGRRLLISGRSSAGAPLLEGAELREIVGDGQTIRLAEPLKKTFVRDSVIVHANVARATHGETRQEILGSGNAAQSFLRFTLHQAPLTFEPAATGTGGTPALKVSVNGIQWAQAPTLFHLGPRDRDFTAYQAADGKTVVQFGDGVSGARLPSGTENMAAAYRVGLGAAGNVKAGSLQILLTRLLGVRGVANLQAAVGGVDPEDAEDARRNVPVTALTIGRMVSLRDYEDFARAVGGVAKARADWMWDGRSGVIFITVLNALGLTMDDATYARLCAAIDEARDPSQRVHVATTDALHFRIHARVVLDPRRREEEVLKRADAALRRAFSLKRREFGQDVTESDILGLLQSVDGVIAADIFEPYPGEEQDNTDWQSQRRLVARLPRLESSTGGLPAIKPAELWMLDDVPDAVRLRPVPSLNAPAKPDDGS